MPIDANDMMIILKDKGMDLPKLLMNYQKNGKELEPFSVSYFSMVQMRFNELMTGARQDVVCKIFGENLDTLYMPINWVKL
jgi:cobalt-zinc-cadmium resistance protein CzcA